MISTTHLADTSLHLARVSSNLEWTERRLEWRTRLVFVVMRIGHRGWKKVGSADPQAVLVKVSRVQLAPVEVVWVGLEAALLVLLARMLVVSQHVLGVGRDVVAVEWVDCVHNLELLVG